LTLLPLRQTNLKGTAVMQSTHHGNRTMMRRDNCMHETKSQAEPLFGSAAITAIETFPDPALLGFRNPHTVIRKGYDDFPSNSLCINFHPSSFPTIFYGIIEQISPHL